MTILYKLLADTLGIVVSGSFGYCLLTLVAAWHYRRSSYVIEAKRFPPISLLTPLSGADFGLAENLRSSFRQAYPDFEILLAVRTASDPAIDIAQQVMLEFPNVPAMLLVTGEPNCANAKVYSLLRMTELAKSDLLVMNDSDIRSSPDMLRIIAAEFADDSVALATCAPRAVPGIGWPSRLEALEMNTHFFGGVMVARLLEGMKFALGPSVVVRRRALDGIGGWRALGDYLAEDFMLGKLIFEAGHKVILSSCRVDHHIGSSGWAPNLEHRLRWARSTRRSRPKGYLGEIFTYPVPLALLLTAIAPSVWPVFIAALLLRAIAAWATAGWVLRDPVTCRYFWLVPMQDVLAVAVWLKGLLGNQITWRGKKYNLYRDGRFKLASASGGAWFPSSAHYRPDDRSSMPTGEETLAE